MDILRQEPEKCSLLEKISYSLISSISKYWVISFKGY